MFQLLKHLPLFAFALLISMSASAAGTGVKSYREWKSEKVSQASLRVNSVKAQLDSKKTDPNMAMRAKSQLEGRDPGTDRLERMLRAEQYDLDLAKDLSVTDYFVGYLTKVQDKKAAFHEVAGKLSPEEVAELMTAYANSVFGAHQADLPVSATNLPKDVK